MSEACIDKPNGTRITIDGTPEEVARILQLIEESPRKRVPKTTKAPAKKKTKAGMEDFILDLKDEGFFNERRSRSEVTTALDAKGHIYSADSVGVRLLRMVRKKQLGRVKEGGKWMYVHRD